MIKDFDLQKSIAEPIELAVRCYVNNRALPKIARRSLSVVKINAMAVWTIKTRLVQSVFEEPD